jgi:hypothetical protein
MFLQANPGFVAANGGRSLITAMLTEPAGTFVPDGTEVFFFADLGTIEASAKTVNGVERTWFVSDSRSGTATVTAYSGGPAPQPSATASPGTGGSVSSTATGTGNASITIAVGNGRAERVLVTANPQVLASARQASVIANVFDASGNPVANVPVIFTHDGSQEFLASGGTPQFTNSNGQAFDQLVTRAPYSVDSLPKPVVVTGTTSNGTTGNVTVTVYTD